MGPASAGRPTWRCRPGPPPPPTTPGWRPSPPAGRGTPGWGSRGWRGGTACRAGAAKPLTTRVAGIGEVKILHHHRLAPGRRGSPDGFSHSVAEPPVAGGRWQAFQGQGDGGGGADGVAAWVQYPAGQMVGVEVQGEARLLAQLRQRRSGITPHPATAAPHSLPHRHPKACPDRLDRPAQSHLGVKQVHEAPLPLIVRSPRDRPRPAARRARRQRLLAGGALVVAMTKLAAHRHIQPCQAAKMLADQQQDLRLGCADPQAGADASASGWCGDERGGERTHVR